MCMLFADIYSSHTSSSFSPSPSDGGAATPNSLILDRENNRLNDNASSVSTITTEDNANGRSVLKKARIEPSGKGGVSGTAHAKSTGGDNGKNGVHHANGEGTYHCQFCEKSFPRLGYLKKHEQVNSKWLLHKYRVAFDNAGLAQRWRLSIRMKLFRNMTRQDFIAKLL